MWHSHSWLCFPLPEKPILYQEACEHVACDPGDVSIGEQSRDPRDRAHGEDGCPRARLVIYVLRASLVGIDAFGKQERVLRGRRAPLIGLMPRGAVRDALMQRLLAEQIAVRQPRAVENPMGRINDLVWG